MKKNVIFDFLHQNQVEKIHSDAIYQFYNLKNLWRDISIALENNISLLNLSSEPITVREIADKIFKLDFSNQPYANPASYNMKSIYASIFNGKSGYLYNKEKILSDMEQFVKAEQAKIK